MRRLGTSPYLTIVAMSAAVLLPRALAAHPGSGIAVDRLGQVYFVDMVSGMWKVDVRGALSHIPGPGFHWMVLDADDTFRNTKLPSGSGGELSRLGVKPTAILASSYPLAFGSDGSLYFPSHGVAGPIQLLKMVPSGETRVVATLPATTAGRPIRDLNGLAAGPDGSLYYTETNTIRRVSKDGRVTIVAQNIAPATCGSVPGMGPADHPLLRGLVVDGSGTIYVAATGCGSVLRVTPEGVASIVFQSDGGWSPTGVALFGTDVYVLEFLGTASDDRPAMIPRVRKVAPDGTTRIIATVSRP